jgi:hypothetical protein
MIRPHPLFAYDKPQSPAGQAPPQSMIIDTTSLLDYTRANAAVWAMIGLHEGNGGPPGIDLSIDGLSEVPVPQQGGREAMKTFLARALVLDAVAVPMMLLYWWLKGPHTVVHLSNCLMIGGVILITIGFLFYGGGRVASGDFTLQYACSVSSIGLAERQQQD